jgi:pre-mRNA-processing factor 39
MKTRMTLATKKELSSYYLMYLQQRGTKVAMKEFLQIDRELNGYVYPLCKFDEITDSHDRPTSIQPAYLKTASTGRASSKSLENGHPVGDIDEATLRRGEVKYSKYFQEKREMPANPQGLIPFL